MDAWLVRKKASKSEPQMVGWKEAKTGVPGVE